MAEVSEGLQGNQKWFLLENKSSPRSERGDSESLIPMRMRRMQNIENAMQMRPYRPIVASLTTHVCVQIAILRERVCSKWPHDKFDNLIFRDTTKLRDSLFFLENMKQNNI